MTTETKRLTELIARARQLDYPYSWENMIGVLTYELEQSIAREAEAKAVALEEAAVDARAGWWPEHCPWVGFLDDRAAALRKEGL